MVSLLIVAYGWMTGYTKTDGGEIAVVRNGGFFDDNSIRDVIDPSSGLVYIGLWSNVHKYPAQQRFFTLTSNQGAGGRLGVDVISVPSKDGVQMGIEGTFYFRLTRNHTTLRAFDDGYGTRQFLGQDNEMLYAYDGEQGWANFLDQIVRPVIENALRQQMGNVRCADLVSSCALVQNQGGVPVDPNAPSNSANIAKVQDEVNRQFLDDLKSTLGGAFFEDVRFNLSRVTLPPSVQEAVDKAQSAFAAVSESQARIQQALADAQANRNRQEGYNACPACAQIDIIRSLPQGVTVYAPGANTAVPLGR
ncbi:SPFH domain-containing protein [Pseudonocardia spinosispora]|uniref:SPFH domain-containing protein n=1 Tax=Pseudonocardia spinosispora TaxID=103441 RepID=UPI001B7FB6C3|nr:SPFH domain-containing protein [Pseudonocardia spinosispora]